jgi:hypothetical protein
MISLLVALSALALVDAQSTTSTTSDYCTTFSGSASTCCGSMCTSASSAYYFLKLTLTISGAPPTQADVTNLVPTLQNQVQGALSLAAGTVTVTQVVGSGGNTIFGSRRLQSQSLTAYISAYLNPAQASTLTSAVASSLSMSVPGASNVVLQKAIYSTSAQSGIFFSATQNSYSKAVAAAASSYSGSLFGSLAFGSLFENNESTNSKISGGVAASFVIACVLALAALVGASRCPCKGAGPDARAKAWHARAKRSRCCLSVGVVAGTLGLLAGIAAPAIPWLSMSMLGGLATFEQNTLYTTATIAGQTTTSANVGDMVNGTYLA